MKVEQQYIIFFNNDIFQYLAFLQKYKYMCKIWKLVLMP